MNCEALGDPTVSVQDLSIEHLVEDKDNLEHKGISVANGVLAYFSDEGLFRLNV